MKTLLALLISNPCFAMSESSAKRLDQALAQSAAELQSLKAERRAKRKAAFEDVTRPTGRKTAAFEPKPLNKTKFVEL